MVTITEKTSKHSRYDIPKNLDMTQEQIDNFSDKVMRLTATGKVGRPIKWTPEKVLNHLGQFIEWLKEGNNCNKYKWLQDNDLPLTFFDVLVERYVSLPAFDRTIKIINTLLDQIKDFQTKVETIDLDKIPVSDMDRSAPRKMQAHAARILFKLIGLKGHRITAWLKVLISDFQNYHMITIRIVKAMQ